MMSISGLEPDNNQILKKMDNKNMDDKKSEVCRVECWTFLYFSVWSRKTEGYCYMNWGKGSVKVTLINQLLLSVNERWVKHVCRHYVLCIYSKYIKAAIEQGLWDTQLWWLTLMVDLKKCFWLPRLARLSLLQQSLIPSSGNIQKNKQKKHMLLLLLLLLLLLQGFI